eukprot:1153720-Pelagomonas_calceolata.AAC.4
MGTSCYPELVNGHAEAPEKELVPKLVGLLHVLRGYGNVILYIGLYTFHPNQQPAKRKCAFFMLLKLQCKLMSAQTFEELFQLLICAGTQRHRQAPPHACPEIRYTAHRDGLCLPCMQALPDLAAHLMDLLQLRACEQG